MYIYNIYIFFLAEYHSVIQAAVQWMIFAPWNLCLPGSGYSPASASWVAGITGACNYTWLIFVFLVETGFHHVVQTGLELLILWFACLRLPKCYNYRCEPPCMAKYNIYSFFLNIYIFYLNICIFYLISI